METSKLYVQRAGCLSARFRGGLGQHHRLIGLLSMLSTSTFGSPEPIYENVGVNASLEAV